MATHNLKSIDYHDIDIDDKLDSDIANLYAHGNGLMANLDATSIEGKFSAGLSPHRAARTQENFDPLVCNIAFIIRFRHGPDITANNVSVVYANTLKDRHLSIMVHKATEQVDVTVSKTVKPNEDVMLELEKIVDEIVQFALGISDMDRIIKRANV